MEKISCVIIDDEKLACDRMYSLLKRYNYIEIVAMCQDPDEGIQNIIKHQPDIVFVDVEMTGKSGFDIINQTTDHEVKTKFIIVTGYDQYAIKAIRKQAFDYILKPIDIDDLTEALNRYKKILKNKQQLTVPKSFIEKYHLSSREVEITLEVAKNKTSQEIADTLFISKHTVDTHRRNILKKTARKNFSEIVAMLQKDN